MQCKFRFVRGTQSSHSLTSPYLALTLDRYMHSLRVLHMDLKAENILLTHSNSAIAPAHSRLGGLTAKVKGSGNSFTSVRSKAGTDRNS